MHTVARRLRHQIDPVKGSRFIATLAPVSSEAEAKALVGDVAAEMSDASHHCTAWRIARPVIDRCSDDGEPSGSAGRPILAQLVGRDLIDVAVVVTRYFGGVRLGVGGLVRAYGSATAAALDEIEPVAYTPMGSLDVALDYSDVDRVLRALAAADATVEGTDYGALVTFMVAAPAARLDVIVAAVADATAGRAVITIDPGQPPG